MNTEITPKLKATLSNSTTFTTLSLIITLLAKCIHYLNDYGITSSTISFFNIGFEKVEMELKAGYQYIKLNEDFETLIKPLKENKC